MATLALSVAGQVAGGLVGGPIGATLGRALGALAGSAVDNALFGDKPHPAPAGGDIRLTGSSEGGAVPRLYGWGRLSGNIIWATQLEERTRQSSGGKGTSPSETTEVLANFAVALCEGEVAHLGRLWADGQLLETEGLTVRFYRGSEDQLPDSLIEAKQGAGNAPAYRGLCYLVFEQLPLGRFGNRIPSISAELCRVVGELEPAIRAVTVIPAATEFGYDPTPRVRVVSPGVTAAENTHQSAQLSDWTVSIDTLQDLCPNLEHVSLVVGWFGDDLRAGECTVAPRVESTTRTVEGASWQVSGLSRAAARAVSQYEGGPAYGGTPSDNAVLAAIADLKARGLKVTLYPLVMMDIPADNGLPDPEGGTGQPAYPWRGRITSAADGSDAAASDVAAFLGGAMPADFTPGIGTLSYAGSDWGYRRMVLHYAGLAAMAGGLDALVIGSELRGLTRLRDTADGFPFVEGLRVLAADARAVAGQGTKLTYAADWSEFSGYQPAGVPGEKVFHLDPLWASPDIDAIGIDNYMPVADWRDGTDHADAAIADGPYELGYLEGNIAGGEGYDWYYASLADRIAGRRTPILDKTYGEPWIWRFKDIAGWWAHAHHDRPAGVRSAEPTAWVPQSKPIWFTELGCAAVDKGANQPNVFGDQKSAESGRPWFSSGAPDPLMQRQALRAHMAWWRPDAPGFEEARNPVSEVYGGRMLDADRIYLWTWDARPFPAFPRQSDIWADADNYASGHWLTGRLGALASDELVAAMAADYGIGEVAAEAARPLFAGATIEAVAALRDALAPALDATGLAVRDRPEGLDFATAGRRIATIAAGERAAGEGALLTRKRADPTATVARLALGYLDRERDYLSGTVTASRLGAGAARASDTRLVLDAAEARYAAERELAALGPAGDTLRFALPPSLAALEAGDVLAVEGEAQGPFRVTALDDGLVRRVSAHGRTERPAALIAADRPAAGSVVTVRALPLVWAAQLPPAPDDPARSLLVLAASADPWPGTITVTDPATGVDAANLTRRAAIGVLAAGFGTAEAGLWDDGNALSVTLYSGNLASLDELAVLAGGNRIALETDSGAWEVIGFASAELVAPATYRLTRLLRGQAGTSGAIGPATAGRRVIVLDNDVTTLPIAPEWLDGAHALTAYAGAADATGTPLAFAPVTAPLLPLSPVHLAARREGGDIGLSWVRRSRADTDSWAVAEAPLVPAPEAYRLSILSGGVALRAVDVAAPGWIYTPVDQAVDFGGPAAAFTFTVAQIDPVWGPGAAGEGALDG